MRPPPEGGGVPALTGLCRRRSLGFGQQRGGPPVSRGRRAPAIHNNETLHGRELPGGREGDPGLPPAPEEVQGTHRQRVQFGRSAEPQRGRSGLWSPVEVLCPAGEVPMPLFSAYGASKAALAVYSKVLRQELSAWGVRVSLIQPSGFRTSTSKRKFENQCAC